MPLLSQEQFRIMAMPAARNSAILISLLPVRSDSFVFKSSSKIMWGVSPPPPPKKKNKKKTTTTTTPQQTHTCDLVNCSNFLSCQFIQLRFFQVLFQNRVTCVTQIFDFLLTTLLLVIWSVVDPPHYDPHVFLAVQYQLTKLYWLKFVYYY